MTVKLQFNFDGYDDFDDFLNEHQETINEMGSGKVNDEDLTKQMRMSVQANEKLPEFFQFTDSQFSTMMVRNQSGMRSLMSDNRVSIHREQEDS